MSADQRVIVCNYTEATNIAAKGAKSYVSWPLGGNLPERIQVLARSRHGRMIHKWEAMRRLTNFRAVTLPPDHPRYGDDRIVVIGDPEAAAARLQACAEEMRGGDSA